MEINLVRIVIMLLSLLIFIGICAWACSSRRKVEFEAPSRLPLDDDRPVNAGSNSTQGTGK